MKKRLTNPFVTGGYISPGCFCDRESETNHLLKAIASKRNITLISLRRMGKTGLLKHISHRLSQTKNPPAVIYVDLMPTMNGNDMLNALSSALLQVKQKEKNMVEKMVTLLAALRPKISYDSLTGQPSIELTIASPAEIQTGFDNLLKFISDIKHDLVFMFDEFQQINQYPEENIEHILRSIIQSYPSIPFIFSGSSKHMLEPMFSAANRPFYQSAELMYLDEIPEPEYRDFIVHKFESGNKKISGESMSKILEWTRLHTFFVQHVCNLIFERENQVIDDHLINEVFFSILTSFEPLYSGYRKLIPPQQYKLLHALAAENGTTQPTSGSFIKKYDLVSASSVTTSLKALSDKEMIVQHRNRWLVYDVFFSRWLERM